MLQIFNAGASSTTLAAAAVACSHSILREQGKTVVRGTIALVQPTVILSTARRAPLVVAVAFVTLALRSGILNKQPTDNERHTSERE